MVHISHCEVSGCPYHDEMSDRDTRVLYVNYSQHISGNLFPDLLKRLSCDFLKEDFTGFINALDCSSEFLETLTEHNRIRTWYYVADNDVYQRERESSSGEENISYYPTSGNIDCVAFLVNSKLDPTGDIRKQILASLDEDKDEYSAENELPDKVTESLDAIIVDDYPRDEEEQIDDRVQATPESPCYYPSQIEMATILKKRIDTIMEHYHNVSSLSEEFDDVEFTVYTARYRMLSDQTEKRICHPDAGVLSREELESRNETTANKKMFMYVRSAETDAHFEQLRQQVKEKPRTLFIIIADECHWGITKDKDQKPSAHNLFINEWCKDSCPRNVVVVQISATPFNLLTQNSRLPEVNCVFLCKEVCIDEKEYKAGDLLVLERESDLEEHVRQTSKEVELHVVHWSEVELKNFERGMRMKLKSTLQMEDSPYQYVKVSSNGEIGVTSNENDATDFILQGSYGVVTMKALVNEEQELAITTDTDGNLEAKVDPQQPATFEVKLDFGVGIAAFSCRDEKDQYLSVNKHGHVTLQPAKVERKCGVSIMKPTKHDKDDFRNKVSFEFYMDRCGPAEINFAGQQYMSLNYYLSTINCCSKEDQKIREDNFFQKIVDDTKRQKLPFKIDTLLCAEYCYYVLYFSVFDSDDKVRQVLTTDMDKSSAAQFQRKLDSFMGQLLLKEEREDKKKCIQPEAFELVRKKLSDKAKQDFKERLKGFAKMQKHMYSASKGGEEKLEDLSEELAASFVFFLMHVSSQDVKTTMHELKTPTIIVEDIKQKLQENDCQKMVEIWSCICQDYETSSLVKSLIQSGKGEEGKMKIVRAKSMETADQFFHTLELAREMSSLKECFEIIRDYGGIQIQDKLMRSFSPFFRKLQSVNCQYKFDCRCTELKLQPGYRKCANCQHVHKLITQYEDLENLACILILVDKGRMGDTFPQSFDCLDLRLSYDSSREFRGGSAVYLSTVIQELGRICRYAKMSSSESHFQNTPYVLVGRELYKKLQNSLVKSSPCISVINCRPDRYMATSTRKVKTSSTLRWLNYEAHKDSYDHKNQQKHCNRILLQAEPQIGKTGTYLCLIKHLRLDILGKEKVRPAIDTAFDEGTFYLQKQCDPPEEFVVDDMNESQDWKFPYWKTIQEAPSLKDKPVASGKYSIGGCFYTHDMEESPFILMERGKQKPTRSAYYYQKTAFADGMRAWHWYHFQNCSECGRLLQGQESVLKTIEVEFDGTEIDVKCSIPASSLRYSHMREQPKSSGWGTAINSVLNFPYWIFHPSHRDDPRKCLFNYNHVMQEKDHVTSYLQVIVVRSEKFQAYRSTWGKVLAIFQLPDELPNCEVGPSEGGVGYARLFIQKMASSLGLEYVFVIDDNVALMSEVEDSAQTESDETVLRDENGVMKMQRCSFLKPLTRLKKIAEGKEDPPVSGNQYEPYPFKDQSEAQQFPLYSYTGPAKLFGDMQHESYGVLGLLRSIPRVARPFAKTQVYAAVLLNVKSTVEKKVFYRPWPCWEDLRFNDDCDKAGLWVVKCNRYLFHKVQYNDWINSLALPSIFQWNEDTKLEKQPLASQLPNDLEESIILEHLNKLIRIEGPDKCFKGQIGYDHSKNSDTAVSPLKLLEQLECTGQDLDTSVPIRILSYLASNPDIERLAALDRTFCHTKEKIIFLTCAEDASGEWPELSLAIVQRICVSSGMRNRHPEFAIFSAADPRRHKLRWILIEALFPGCRLRCEKMNESIDGTRTLDPSSAEQNTKAGREHRTTAGRSEWIENDVRGSKRPMESCIEDPEENKRRLMEIQVKHKDVQNKDRSSVDGGYLVKGEENRGPACRDSASGSSKRVPDIDPHEGPTHKKLKGENRLPSSTTASHYHKSKKLETLSASHADNIVDLPSNENVNEITGTEQRQGSASSIETSSQLAKKNVIVIEDDEVSAAR